MNGGRDRNSSSNGASHRGLLKLLVKLPSVRGRLQMIAAKPSSLNDLFEAYDAATDMLQRLERNGSDELLLEYRTICQEIETDVIRYCLEHM
jgi:hypothetical protein